MPLSVLCLMCLLWCSMWSLLGAKILAPQLWYQILWISGSVRELVVHDKWYNASVTTPIHQMNKVLLLPYNDEKGMKQQILQGCQKGWHQQVLKPLQVLVPRSWYHNLETLCPIHLVPRSWHHKLDTKSNGYWSVAEDVLHVSLWHMSQPPLPFHDEENVE